MNKLIIGVLLIAVVGCKNKATEKQEIKKEIGTIALTSEQVKNAGITTTILSSNKVESVYRAFGNIYYSPENVVTITCPYGGIVKSIAVTQGDVIQKGQRLATIEDPQIIQIQQDYLLTKAKLKFAKLDYERQRELNQSKANSDKVFQLSEADYRTNQILLNALAEKLQLLGIRGESLTDQTISRAIPIRSTISGVVTAVHVNKGKYVLPSEGIFEIINQSQPLLKLKLFEKDMSKIYKGMRLKAYHHNLPEEKMTCEVIGINRIVASDGGIEVICRFLSNSSRLVHNMSMIADIELTSSDQMTLPEDAIVHFEGKDYIFVEISTHQYHMIEILLGESSNGRVEIKNMQSLQGKRIVQTGAYSILMAMKNMEE